MIDPANVPPVEAEEWLARYVVHSSHIRPSNQTLKPDAFIPHPYLELSVTRHLLATEQELWAIGKNVAQAVAKVLHGRGDFRASACLSQRLTVDAAPTDDNPNHANVCGWPADKPAQKIIAQEIAALAIFTPKP
jgi:hypothetical protein